MRKHIWSLYVLTTIILLIASGCEKESPVNAIAPPPPPPAPSPVPLPIAVNTPPNAYAGQDIWVVVPANSATLKGEGYDTENNIDSHVWKQVSGPSSAIIENPGSLGTKVASLEKGTYEFELSITDKGGLNDKDTVTVFVREPAAPGHGEVIIKDLQWSCPMGCTVQINCIYCLVPINQPFKVYLRERNSNDWIEAIPEANWADNDKYIYGIYNNNLWIYTNDDDDKVDVKITY